MKTFAIILASGSGERVNFPVPKQFIKLGNKTIIEHTIDVFEKVKIVDEIVIVINPSFKNLFNEILLKNNYKKIKKVIDGGKTRKDSSYIGINAIEESEAKVLIHDVVRPFVSERIIKDCVASLDNYSATCAAIPFVDTVAKICDGKIIETPSRESFVRLQTPQGFKLSLIKKAHDLAKEDDFVFTDDTSLILKYNLADISIVNGDEKNIKITYKEDLFLAEKLLNNN